MNRSEIRIYGIDVHERSARNLISALTKEGTTAALAAADQLSGALDRHVPAGPLTPEMRDAILAVMPPQPGLRHLHRALRQDHVAREGLNA